MVQFNFTAYDPTGRRISGNIDAPSRTSALDVLARQGCYPTELDDARTEIPHWTKREVFGGGALSAESLGTLTRELASLSRAGLPIDECLRLMALQPMLAAKVRRIIRSLQTSVSEGQSLSSSMAAQAGTFPEYYWRLVQASEKSGALDSALDDLATYLEAASSMRARVMSALIYPAILLIAAIIAIGVVVGVLIPALTPLFEDARVPPPALVSTIAAIDVFVRGNWIWLVLASFAAVAAAIYIASSQAARLWFDGGLLRVPVFGRIIERRETGRLARTLAMLIKGGIPLVEATNISASVMSNRAMALHVADASQRTREGDPLSAPLARSGVFSELFVRLVSLGEQTGQLEPMLFRAADIYDGALQRQLQRLIGLITPVVTIVVGGLIGLLILSVMSALMSINDLALQ